MEQLQANPIKRPVLFVMKYFELSKPARVAAAAKLDQMCLTVLTQSKG
jgi:hypothetical protein